MKMSIFCYVVTFKDHSLTIYEFAIAVRNGDVISIMDRPGVVVGELMSDAVIVYIDILCINGELHTKPRPYMISLVLESEYPPMYLRRLARRVLERVLSESAWLRVCPTLLTSRRRAIALGQGGRRNRRRRRRRTRGPLCQLQ